MKIIKKGKQLHKIKDKKTIVETIDKLLRCVLYIMLAILTINIIFKFIANNDKAKYNIFIIVSESMEPNIKVGDIVVENKISEDNLAKGDIITYKTDGENITHRIVNIEVIDNVTYYTTKGDNNKIEDKKRITYDDIRGKVIAKIPFIGNFILNNALQKTVFIILIICILVYIETKKIEAKKIKRKMKKELEDDLYFEKNQK